MLTRRAVFGLGLAAVLLLSGCSVVDVRPAQVAVLASEIEGYSEVAAVSLEYVSGNGTVGTHIESSVEFVDVVAFKDNAEVLFKLFAGLNKLDFFSTVDVSFANVGDSLSVQYGAVSAEGYTVAGVAERLEYVYQTYGYLQSRYPDLEVKYVDDVSDSNYAETSLTVAVEVADAYNVTAFSAGIYDEISTTMLDDVAYQTNVLALNSDDATYLRFDMGSPEASDFLALLHAEVAAWKSVGENNELNLRLNITDGLAESRFEYMSEEFYYTPARDVADLLPGSDTEQFAVKLDSLLEQHFPGSDINHTYDSHVLAVK